jgi:NAD(P)-dependent dehydrogenase (short-subunit alcohol dehydrogenase family)
MSVDYVRRLFGLEGQTAVVLGGSGRIGGAICEGLGRAGATLVVAGRSASRGHKRVEVVRALSGTAGFRHVDVLERDSIQGLLDYALGEYGVVDILVNSVHARMEAEENEPDDQVWRRAVDVHSRGTYWACQTFAAHMAKQSQGGAILNIDSAGGWPLHVE